LDGNWEIRVPRVSSKTIMNAPTDVIWQVISEFGAACQHFVMVTGCTD
jgi:hypothetical protein